MKKLYKIIVLFFLFTFISTYSPSEVNITKNNKFFFKVKNIKVNNLNRIDEKVIISKLSHIYKKNILFLSKNDLAGHLTEIDFLEKIEVKKNYPNTIIIKIYETKPIGILSKNNNKYIIDNLSNLISFNKTLLDRELPNVFGKDSEKDFVIFLKQLESNNFPIDKVKNYYYFQIDRWDLQLRNTQIIKFPNDKRGEAIKQSVELLKRSDFKNYKTIDLRIHGKIVVD